MAPILGLSERRSPSHSNKEDARGLRFWIEGLGESCSGQQKPAAKGFRGGVVWVWGFRGSEAFGTLTSCEGFIVGRACTHTHSAKRPGNLNPASSVIRDRYHIFNLEFRTPLHPHGFVFCAQAWVQSPPLAARGCPNRGDWAWPLQALPAPHPDSGEVSKFRIPDPASRNAKPETVCCRRLLVEVWAFVQGDELQNS